MLPPWIGAGLIPLSQILACLALAEARTAYSLERSPEVHIIRPHTEATCLAPSALQTASAFTGQEDGIAGTQPGQVKSEVDNANFINFCDGQLLTNGRQIADGSCNGIPMGRIPAATNMISSIIVHPQVGDELPANRSFNVSVQTAHLRSGFQANPSASYYSAPQNLDEDGDIIGHCHVTIQDIGSLRAIQVPDPQDFTYFTVINTEGEAGLLETEIMGGLPEGAYRICTMIVARNHQPVVMPIGQRGAQDDCTKFVVVGDDGAD